MVFSMYGQQESLIRLEILNPVIIKERKQDAIKLDVQLSSSGDKIDSLFFYKYYKHIPSLPFVYDSTSLIRYKGSSVGLNYIIEDNEGNIINAKDDLPPSFVNIENEIGYAVQKKSVNERTLKIKRINVDYLELNNYQLSNFLLVGNDTTVSMYPLLSSFHSLSPGKYKLYLFYSFNNEYISLIPSIKNLCDSNKSNDSLIFRGVIISNKVDLIVK